MANKHVKIFFTSYVIKYLNNNDIPLSVWMIKFKNTGNTNADKDVEQQELSHIANRNEK